jgi:Na+/H+-dicarboxylate symporter
MAPGKILSPLTPSQWFYLFALAFGVLSGFSEWSMAHTLASGISDVFIRIFKCISLPLISISILVSLANMKDEGHASFMWKRAIRYTIATTLISALIAFFLYLIIRPAKVLTSSHLDPSSAQKSIGDINYSDQLIKIIPENIFSPFISNNVLSVLLIGSVIGIAINYIPNRESRQTVRSFFNGFHDLLLIITGWIVTLIPIGLYGFVTITILQLKSGAHIAGIGEYVGVILLSNLIQGFIILPLFLFINHIAPFKAMHSMLPALSLAFFSKSSVATLPLTMKTAEERLGISAKVSRAILPFCTTCNMNGCAAFIFTTVIYVMENNGASLTPGSMLIWVGIATLASIGNAGVPMGCYFLSASLLASMDIPITLMGIILPFYAFLDMLETSLNVWSDSCVTMVVDGEVKEAARKETLTSLI